MRPDDRPDGHLSRDHRHHRRAARKIPLCPDRRAAHLPPARRRDRLRAEAACAWEVEARAYARDLVIGLRAIERGTRPVAPVVEPATTPTPGTPRALDDPATRPAGHTP